MPQRPSETGTGGKSRSYRFREFTLIPDDLPDAEPVTHALQCAVCEDQGDAKTDLAAAKAWAVRHLRSNPEHFTYRHIVQRPYRFQPGAWQ
ncbi:hypothetical protein HUT18_11430 [Streptomyces sp. NA04227]|nr:hypothetical protein HUT18_11430 [Streptomyces sp. NA04227]